MNTTILYYIRRTYLHPLWLSGFGQPSLAPGNVETSIPAVLPKSHNHTLTKGPLGADIWCCHSKTGSRAEQSRAELSLQPATRGDKEHKVTFDATHIYLDESSQSVDSIAKHNRTGAMPVHLVRCLYSQT